MRRKRGHRKSVSGLEVDLTPLIDCVFQLLIFFMVTTVFIHTRGIDVDLPALSRAAESVEKKDINIIIEADGRIEIEGEEVEEGKLVERIKKAMVENKNDNIIIQADPEVFQERVVEVMDAARMAGVKGIAFAREKPGG